MLLPPAENLDLRCFFFLHGRTRIEKSGVGDGHSVVRTMRKCQTLNHNRMWAWGLHGIYRYGF